MKEWLSPQATGDVLWVTVGSPAGLIAVYLASVNLWAFGLMWFDKRRARSGGRRIRERTLFLSALAGGGLGALLGMWTFRHKTKHWYFVVGIPIILAVELAGALWLAVRWMA